jgi:nitronate monooxygenase
MEATTMWPDRRIIELFKIEHPILLAPMAGPSTAELAIAVSEAGGLGSFGCALSTPDQIRTALGVIRQRTTKPLNLNFFVHKPPATDAAREAKWNGRLAAYHTEFGVDPTKPFASPHRTPFGEPTCAIVEEFKPDVVSFHFGLPQQHLLDRVKIAGCKIIASATSAKEARWLADRGCDAIIAQGYEAGGHRGMFLTDNVASQAGTLALVPQVVDAVPLPVIAAGGIADARGVAAAFALGAAAVQIGTAYLFCPEANVPALNRKALKSAKDDETALTNVFTGRPARGVINRAMRELGPISPDAPAFPLASGALAPIKAAAEAKGSSDFTSLWSGQSASLCREMPAGELTRQLARMALAHLKWIGGQ